MGGERWATSDVCPPPHLSSQSVVKIMYDIGRTNPEVLYDFTIRLEAAGWAMLDPESDLCKAYRELLDSCWGQMPQKILIDFTCDE